MNDFQHIHFKFKWLDDEGNQTGFLNKKGSFDGETLQLDDTAIPAAAIVDMRSRQTIAVISVLADEIVTLAFAVNSGNVQQLKQAIDISRSRAHADFHKQEMIDKGRGAAYREEVCPYCSATSVMTDMERTPQLYCHFCDSLVTLENQQTAPANEHDFRLCDECGLYSKPRKFTVFYFYFLLVIYGWRYRTTWRCPACMRNDAWLMLLGNLPFVLGVPVALVQLIRSYSGSVQNPAFAGLDSANIKVTKGDISGAVKKYGEIVQRIPFCAGVKYNLATGLLRQQDLEHAKQTLLMALDDCSNYTPAFNALCHCYEQTGDHAALKSLHKQWGIEEEQPPDEQRQNEIQAE